MAILAGIDEAGFGPVLGPLVVSTAVLRLPDEIVDANLWSLLAGAVTRKSLRRSPAMPLADSKAMHVRSDGVVHLERGVLGMLTQMGPMPTSLGELLRRVAPRTRDDAQAYPWYAGQNPALPHQADARDLTLRANGAAEAMRKRGIVLESLRAEPVLAGDYNRLVQATRNKASALFGVTSRLIAYVFNTYAEKNRGSVVRIVADRQGGRIHYRHQIQRMFEGATIRVLEETDAHSGYHVDQAGRVAEIHFMTQAEKACLPVALASMLCKYLRELLMDLLNAYWGRRVEGLKPTAGYYVDGRRFLKDIAAAMESERTDASLLIRSR